MPVPTWTSQDGRSTPIKDLGDSHLMNIIRMLIRKAPASAKYMASQLETMGLVPSVILTLADLQRQTLEQFIQMLYPIWKDLKAEAERRGFVMLPLDTVALASPAVSAPKTQPLPPESTREKIKRHSIAKRYREQRALMPKPTVEAKPKLVVAEAKRRLVLDPEELRK